MRKILNRLLSNVGYRIERQSRFNLELDRLAMSKPSGFVFVQIGANDGVRFDALYSFVTTHACRGIVVEPLPDMFNRLRVNYADYPNITPVNQAVHESARALSLFRVNPAAVSRYPGWASGIASFDRAHLIAHAIQDVDIVEETVPCMPLMELLETTRTLDADLLQIDTEGYDAAVIRMIDFQRFRPTLVKFEHKALRTEHLQEVVALLRSQGYKVRAEGTDTVAWRG